MSRLPRANKLPLLATLLALLALVGAVASTALAQDADPAAPTPADGKITREMTVGVVESEAPTFDVTRLGANPGDAVVLHGDFRNSAVPHNIHATEGAEGSPKSAVKPNELHTISFLMPETGEVKVVCDVHPSMTLSVVPVAQLAATAGLSVPGLGVHFLAYWVGLIAFAFLFVVYGATFFLFKYNETNATTDHWDRSDAAAGKPGLARSANLLALVIAIVAVAAVVYVAMMR